MFFFAGSILPAELQIFAELQLLLCHPQERLYIYQAALVTLLSEHFGFLNRSFSVPDTVQVLCGYLLQD